MDHCQTGSHDCDAPERASCSYTGGSSFTCSCLPGFVGDGKVCRGEFRVTQPLNRVCAAVKARALGEPSSARPQETSHSCVEATQSEPREGDR